MKTPTIHSMLNPNCSLTNVTTLWFWQDYSFNFLQLYSINQPLAKSHLIMTQNGFFILFNYRQMILDVELGLWVENFLRFGGEAWVGKGLGEEGPQWDIMPYSLSSKAAVLCSVSREWEQRPEERTPGEERTIKLPVDNDRHHFPG